MTLQEFNQLVKNFPKDAEIYYEGSGRVNYAEYWPRDGCFKPRVILSSSGVHPFDNKYLDL